jgi:hypothetical protein
MRVPATILAWVSANTAQDMGQNIIHHVYFVASFIVAQRGGVYVFRYSGVCGTSSSARHVVEVPIQVRIVAKIDFVCNRFCENYVFWLPLTFGDTGKYAKSTIHINAPQLDSLTSDFRHRYRSPIKLTIFTDFHNNKIGISVA